MTQKADKLLPVMTGQPVIPVIQIRDAATAAPLSRALAAGGLPAVEITLRTPDALEAIRIASAEAPDAIVGAGTILSPRQFDQAVEAGARFIVSPGITPELLAAAEDSDVPLLPGAITPGEIMTALEKGYSLLKFFPAEQAGGAAFVKALASPLAAVRFCPTGGIGAANAASYLSLPNVLCVGGSWVAPEAMIASGDWKGIEKLAREAAGLSRR